ncbi:MAG: MFS transporter [Thiolinea sp.]
MKSFIPLIKTEWRLLLFGFIMAFASSPGQTYFIALFSGEIRADLGLSHGDFGAIYSLGTLCSAAVLLWSGALIDRIDLRKFSYAIVVGLAIGCLAMSVSQNVIMLFIGILLLRQFGQGLMYMIGTAAMVRYLDENKGKANALNVMGYSVAEAILPSAVIAFFLWLSWRESWVFWAAALLVCVPLSIRWLLRGHDKRHQDYLASLEEDENDAIASKPKKYRRRQWTRAEVLRDPMFYLFLPGLMAQPLLFTGFMFHQVHLVEVKGWSLALWGSLYLLYAAVSVGVKFFAGVLVDHYGAIRLVPWVTLPLGVGLFVMSLSSSLVVAVIFMVGLGITVALCSIVTAPFFSDMYGNRHLGAIKSVSTSAMVFMSALSPVALGWLIDAGVSMETLMFWGACYVVLTSGIAFYACWLKLKSDVGVGNI